LDPAGPLFHMNSPNERLASSDGDYVEVIHTNGWTLGFGEPIGQSDFFPNWGSSQPGVH
jgi:pancreatic triacylglycerol lipase